VWLDGGCRSGCRSKCSNHLQRDSGIDWLRHAGAADRVLRAGGSCLGDRDHAVWSNEMLIAEHELSYRDMREFHDILASQVHECPSTASVSGLTWRHKWPVDRCA